MNAPKIEEIHNVEAEQALLGCFLPGGEKFDEVRRIMGESDLWTVKHQWIWSALVMVYERDGGDISSIAVASELQQRGKLEQIGGVAYLIYLGNQCESPLLAPVYAHLVRDCSERRRMLGLASEVAVAAHKGVDMKTILDRAQAELGDISTRESTIHLVNFETLYQRRGDQYLEWASDPQAVRGLASKIKPLDDVLCGFGEGLYSFYGATSMGKSVLMRQLAIQFALQGIPGIVIPSEMSADLVFDFMVAERLHIPYKHLKTGRYRDLPGIFQASQWLRGLPIQVLDCPSPSPAQIAQFVKQKRRLGRCEWIIVDSGSNLSVPGETEIYNQTRIAANALKDIATEFHIPVIASWQIGRNDKGKSNPIPRLGDGKGASEIEYNSRVVVGIFRPAYYAKRGVTLPANYVGANDDDAYLFVLKDREGGAGDDVAQCSFAPERGLGFHVRAVDVQTGEIHEGEPIHV